jgi:hypothetical protein
MAEPKRTSLQPISIVTFCGCVLPGFVSEPVNFHCPTKALTVLVTSGASVCNPLLFCASEVVIRLIRSSKKNNFACI